MNSNKTTKEGPKYPSGIGSLTLEPCGYGASRIRFPSLPSRSVIEKLVDELPWHRSLSFYDASQNLDSRNDPGVYHSIKNDYGTLKTWQGNHGWSSSECAISRNDVVDLIVRCLQWNMGPDHLIEVS